MRKIFGLIVAGAALLAASAANAQSNKLTVAVGGKTIIAYLPLPVAYYGGFFKSEGIEVDLQDVQNGPKAVEAMVGAALVWRDRLRLPAAAPRREHRLARPRRPSLGDRARPAAR
jgi:ABC-type nitrate/sulfonate/bicarbonate transport system substrate-binding protein